ncbi:MAG: helix-turn-helix domain-containing protein [Candidatus Aenigmatarchaeota archaeon]
MWVARLKVFIPEDILWKSAEKSNVVMHAYPIKHYIKNYNVYYVVSGVLVGEMSNKRHALTELKNNKWTISLESKGDYFLLVTYRPLKIKEEIQQSVFFNLSVLYIKPIIIEPSGFMEITIGSWTKKNMSGIIKYCKDYYKGKLISIKKEKFTSMGILFTFGLLTEKQRKVIELAIKNGYYEYPRQVELKNLAKIIGISFSTYRTHLRKAEKKIMPFLLNAIK